jgi:hypothetical protein
MRKYLIAGCATISLIAGMATPAMALPTNLGDEAPELNSICQVQPNVRSGFIGLAENVQLVELSSVTVDTGPTTIVGNGTPTASASGFTTPHRHGGSPNIFAYVDTSLVYATATATTPTQTTTTYQYLFDCHVHKTIKGKGNDDLHGVGYNAPPDQQSYGITSEEFTVVTTGERTETLYNWTAPGGGIGDDTLICNIPQGNGPNSGWQKKNGWTGECSTDFYNSLSVGG